MKNSLLLSAFGAIALTFIASTSIAQQRTIDAETENRYINECRDEGHMLLREEIKQLKKGGPVDEAERTRILDSLYNRGLLYGYQVKGVTGVKSGIVNDISAPVPLGTEHSFANNRLQGHWHINHITNDQDGVRLDRTVYDPIDNHIYAINTMGSLVDGKLVNTGALLRKNQKVIIEEKGFTGVRTSDTNFRLVAAINGQWTSGTFFYSDNQGLTWTRSQGADYTATEVFWTETLANGDILSLISRKLNGVDHRCIIRSVDKGVSFEIIHSWPLSTTARIVATRLYNTDDNIVIIRKLKDIGTWEIYGYENNTVVEKGTLASTKVPATITGTYWEGKPHVYVGCDGDGGFYSEDGKSFSYIATLEKDLETVCPYNPKLVFSRLAQHDYSADGGLTWQKYPNNNGTVGWDPKHTTFYKDKSGNWMFVIGNDMGLSFNKTLTPLVDNWQYVNNKHNYAILHGGVTNDDGLLITCNQDPGTFELQAMNDGTYLARKRRGADGLRAAIANGGKSFWFKHYWNQYFRSPVSNNNTDNLVTHTIVSQDWYTPPFVGSTVPGEDAIFVSGFPNLIKLTYNASTNKINRRTLPYNFFTMAGDSTYGVATTKLNPNRLYVATKNKRFFISDDGGNTWRESAYNGPKPSPNSKYNQGAGYFIEVSENDPNLLVWGGSKGSAAVLISRDGGETFSPLMNGMPTTENILNVSMSPDGDVLFSSNFYVYFSDENRWYPMKGESLPAGIVVKSATYLPKTKKVRYFTWGAGVLDFNISDLKASLATATHAAKFDNNILVYPNPTNGLVQLKTDINLAGNAQIQIINTLGQVIQVVPAPLRAGEVASLDMRSYAAGIYGVRILQNGEVVANKRVFKK